jgi:transcriptional regulator with XRE-family HTH domain
MNRSDEPRGHFVARVARLQQDRGLSDDDLAQRAKLTKEELSAILQGEGPIPPDVIFLLAGALNVAPGNLLVGMEWVPGQDGGNFRVEDPEGD